MVLYADVASGTAKSGICPSGRDRLIELGGDDLAEKLDSLHRKDVTDQSVFT